MAIPSHGTQGLTLSSIPDKSATMTKTSETMQEPPQEEIAVAYDEASKALSEWCVLTF